METLTPNRILAERYRLDEVLATGDGVTLWRATDTLLNRAVRIRTLGTSDPPDIALDHARRAASCCSPRLIPVLDADRDGDHLFSVHGPAEAPSLERTLSAGPLDQDTAIRTALAALAGIQELRRCEVPHRPPTADQIYGLGDAAALDAIGAEPGASAQEDVRAVATILYRSLTGREPARTPLPLRSVDPRIDRDIDDVTLRALAGSFSTPEALAGALGRIPSDIGSVDHEPSPEPHQRWFRAWMLIPLALAAITGLVIASGLIIARGGRSTDTIDRPTPALLPPRTIDQEITTTAARNLTATAFDPFGDDAEGNGSLAIDGNPSTAWETEWYEDGNLGKPGVGLLIALDERASVAGFRLRSPIDGWAFQVRVGDDAEALTDARAQTFHVRGPVREEIDPSTGRYVLIWVTDLALQADGNGRAAISEIQIDLQRMGASDA